MSTSAMSSTYNALNNSLNLLGKILARPEGFEPPTCGFVELKATTFNQQLVDFIDSLKLVVWIKLYPDSLI